MRFVTTKYVPKPNTVAEFGCDTEEQLRQWRPEICGVCCLKTIGDPKGRTTNASLWELTMQCLEQNAFIVDSRTGKIDGIFYKPLLKVAQMHGLHGFILPRLPLPLLNFLLAFGLTPILSIDLHKIDPKYEAGHLIVVTGHDRKNKTYTVHDSSSVLAKSGNSVPVNAAILKHASNNRGLVLY